MSTERIDTKSLLAENRKTCDWVTSRGLTFSMSGDDAREILDALAQELSDAAVLRERIRLLEELVDDVADHYDIAPNGLRWREKYEKVRLPESPASSGSAEGE